MKIAAVCAVLVCLLPAMSHAAPIYLGALTCDKYENEIMNAPAASQHEDAVDVVMWLFGFAVAKSGAHVMYGDALQQFGNSLDIECKVHPNNSLLDTLATVKLANTNPMDLDTLGCATFEARHVEMAQSDPQSANTIICGCWVIRSARSAGVFSIRVPLPRSQRDSRTDARSIPTARSTTR